MRIDQSDIKGLSDEDVRRFLDDLRRQCVEHGWGPGTFGYKLGEALHAALTERTTAAHQLLDDLDAADDPGWPR